MRDIAGSHSNRILAHCDDGDGNRLPLSFAVGAVIAGVVADRLGISSAMWLIAALTFGSGLFVFLRMRERRMQGYLVEKNRSSCLPRSQRQHPRFARGDGRHVALSPRTLRKSI